MTLRLKLIQQMKIKIVLLKFLLKQNKLSKESLNGLTTEN